MKYKNSNKIMSIYLMFGLILLVIGFSYAFFIYNKTGLYTHTITGGKMKVIYDETTDNNITIENSYPLTDKEALTKALEFEFTVTGYNESDKNIYYAIEIAHGNDVNGKTRFKDSDMKLTLFENSELIFENEVFNNLDNQDIYYNYFKAGTNSQNPIINNYKLRIWISDYVYISDTIENDLIEWEDEDFEWFIKRYPNEYFFEDDLYIKCPDFYDGTSNECSLNDFGLNVYTSDEFANNYASYKVNVRANLTADGIGVLFYDANGGSFTPKPTSLATNMITMQKPVMENKGFLGWSTTPNGEVEWKSGEYYSGKAQTLYAIYGDSLNVMGRFSDEISNIDNIYFVNETGANIEQFADETINSGGEVFDLTHDDYLDVGNVVGILNNNSLYVMSDGTTYLTDCTDMFYWLSLDELSLVNADTSMVTDMSGMFSECDIDLLDLSGFNTSKVESMSGMFYRYQVGGRMIHKINGLENFDTSNVEDMSYMFYNCLRLNELNLTNFNTSNVINMSNMFCRAGVINNLDVRGFDTSQVLDMSYMFRGDSYVGVSILKITGLENFDTSNVITMEGMFYECSGVREFNLSSFNTINVENMSYMFYSTSFDKLDLRGVDTSNVKTMESMFEWNYSTSIDLSDLDTSSVENMSRMFYRCSRLEKLNLSNFDTSNVNDMSYMFALKYSSEEYLKDLDLSHFDTSSLINMSGMFSEREKLFNLDISSFDFSAIEYYDSAFDEMSVDAKIYVGSITDQELILNISSYDRPAWTTDNIIVKNT